MTVTELLTRQASPALCTDSSAGERDDITDTIPVVVAPVSHRRPPARAAQLAKMASIGVAGAVLCGAVAVSSMISQQRRENAQPAVRPTVQITGDQALLPDRLGRTVAEAPAPAPAPPPADEPVAASTPSATSTAPPPPAATPSGGTSASADTGHAEPAPADDLALVRAFYENLPDAPADAFQLLAPELLNSGLGEFLRSWSHVVAIDSVDVVQQADGVLATVRMRLLGGGHLRIQQLLTVAESPRRIVGVQLLSAQRN
ncbi:hypothetical protein [Actinophytocola sp. KF-1]